ncbi:RagB/SusD family nutrient uptake outer membrane protein [Sphingobacterium sp. LRF_L2]|uniref:RagB/SusD family nutrient uptake outer membrane protein n=1 Tax=Sphingobacterium sp. LRF_L2 TaxID=3369421 RepID=UPI003F625BC4
MKFFKQIKSIIFLVFALFLGLFQGCNYLDVVPDNVATLENAFAMRNTAEKYLFTCYSWLPNFATLDNGKVNPALLAGDEFWGTYGVNAQISWRIARGEQGVSSPLLNYWDGENAAPSLYQAIRDCNVFLENINQVPDMTEDEKQRWTAEVKFLKGYFHFWLIRMYGPIVLVDQNLDIDAGVSEVRQARIPLDSCINYVVRLFDEAYTNLPDVITNESSELGRITKTINLAVKAYALTWAASPLFNGNTDYASLLNRDGTTLISQTNDVEKWGRALAAIGEAISFAEEQGVALYEYQPGSLQAGISDTTRIQTSIRNVVTERWNKEVIWADPNSVIPQNYLTPRSWDPAKSNDGQSGRYGVPFKVVDLFYTAHGVPIDEDKTWDYASRYTLKTATNADRYNISTGYTTALQNFDRENRFYANLGFDGGIWYGQGKWDDNSAWHLEAKNGQYTGIFSNNYNVTGYWPKKLININNLTEASSYVSEWYPWPVIRLADLYLLYAEASNEYYGANEEALNYLNKIRARAGLETVESSWTNYSNIPDKYLSQDGLRQIIHRERLVELLFEGHRFWDLRRWKEAEAELNKDIVGWSVQKGTQQEYYQPVVLFSQKFQKKEYLWPIKENSIIVNRNLVQNTGW